MNGVRSIFRRKGYLLTALSAAVLLAASSGTALAQVTITGPAMNTVNEGDTVTLNVAVKGYIAVGQVDNPTTGTVTVTVNLPLGAAATLPVTLGDEADISRNLQKLSVMFTRTNASTTNRLAFSATGTLSVVTTQDLDAEDEFFTWGNYGVASTNFTLDNPAGETVATPFPNEPPTGANAPPASFTIKDDETQRYVLALNSTSPKPEEGATVTVDLTAMPEHD